MNRIVHRATVCSLIFLLSAAAEPLAAQQQAQPEQQPAQNSTQPPIELPENPGRSSSTPSPNTPVPQSNVPPPAPQPSGTAVAPEVQVSGGAASKPAGVAIEDLLLVEEGVGIGDRDKRSRGVFEAE